MSDNLDTPRSNVDTSSPNISTTWTPNLDTSNSNMATSSNITTMTPNHDTSIFTITQIAGKSERKSSYSNIDTEPNVLSVFSFSLHLHIPKNGTIELFQPP